jgi:outer membrane protein assembly factor BamB
MWAAIKVPQWLELNPMVQFQVMFMAPMGAAAAILAWWLFVSRVRWTDRLIIPLLCAAIGGGVIAVCQPEFRFFGLILYMLPWVTTAWVGWLLLTPFLRWQVRRAGLVLVLVLVWGYFALIRFDGVDGNFTADLNWRWAPTAEERFLAERGGESGGVAPAPAGKKLMLQSGDWPGFRGAGRDSKLSGVRIATDWKQNPPRPLWRRRVGPGWSSFAVVGNRLFTQEQRKDAEVVTCYDADTGKQLWAHEDATRFTELVAGPGPRATPTFHEGQLFTLGANGTLNCLDAATGKAEWSANIVVDADAKVPTWGFASSPLIVKDLVLVYTGSAEGKGMLAYKIRSGKLAWAADDAKHSYCSPQLARLANVDQVLVATEAGMTSFHPSRGQVLWQHDWPTGQTPRCTQPAVVNETDVLVATGLTAGTRRLHVGLQGGNWSAEEVWTTMAIKPYFNDFVLHKGHLYGFDGDRFTCASLEDGQSRWKARGYGNGQVLLIADQDLLLILGEKGQVALVEANPERHKELGKFQAIEGKTWNHPVLAHGKLFVRNGEEAACYQVADEKGGK